MLIILFGPPGSGKNYVADVLREDFGYCVYDADDDLTPAMLRNVAENRLHTDEERDEYVRGVIARLAGLVGRHPKLVVTHAFTKERSRRQVREAFPEARWVLVQADPLVVERRLLARPRHVVPRDYGMWLLSAFECPETEHEVLVNDAGREEVVEQLRRLGA